MAGVAPLISPVNVAPVTNVSLVRKKSSAASISEIGGNGGGTGVVGRLAAAIALFVFPVLKITGLAFVGRLKATAQANKNGADTTIFLMAHPLGAPHPPRNRPAAN